MDKALILFIETTISKHPCPQCRRPIPFDAIESAGMRKKRLPEAPGSVPVFCLEICCPACGHRGKLNIEMPTDMALMAVAAISKRFRSFAIQLKTRKIRVVLADGQEVGRLGMANALCQILSLRQESSATEGNHLAS